MSHSPFCRLSRIASASLLCYFAAYSAANAQLISPRSVFTDETAVGHAVLSDAGLDWPTLFLSSSVATASSICWRDRFVALNYDLSSAVRTVRGGVHIGDLYGSDEGFGLTYSAPRLLFSRAVRLDLRLSGGSENALTQDIGSGKTTAGSVNDSETAFRLAFQAGQGAVWLGYEADNVWIPGNSDMLGGSLPLFDSGTSPDFNWHWARRGGFLGACLPVGHSGVVLQGDFSPRLVFPGSLSATATTVNAAATAVSGIDAPAQLTVPFDTSGNGWDLTAQAPLGRKTTLLAWSGRFDATGSGTVIRNDVPSADGAVGPSQSRLGEVRAGVAVQRRLSVRDTRDENLTLTYHGSWTRFSTAGLDLPAAGLGYTDGQFDAAYYHLNASAAERSLGITWDRPLRHGQGFGLDYRWVETPLHVDYGYAGRVFLFFDVRDETWKEPNARGHLLQARYSLPIGRRRRNAYTDGEDRRPCVKLAALQIIPLPTTRRSSESSNTYASPQPSRHTTGGWSLSASLAQPF